MYLLSLYARWSWNHFIPATRNVVLDSSDSWRAISFMTGFPPWSQKLRRGSCAGIGSSLATPPRPVVYSTIHTHTHKNIKFLPFQETKRQNWPRHKLGLKGLIEPCCLHDHHSQKLLQLLLSSAISANNKSIQLQLAYLCFPKPKTYAA